MRIPHGRGGVNRSGKGGTAPSGRLLSDAIRDNLRVVNLTGEKADPSCSDGVVEFGEQVRRNAPGTPFGIDDSTPLPIVPDPAECVSATGTDEARVAVELRRDERIPIPQRCVKTAMSEMENQLDRSDSASYNGDTPVRSKSGTIEGEVVDMGDSGGSGHNRCKARRYPGGRGTEGKNRCVTRDGKMSVVIGRAEEVYRARPEIHPLDGPGDVPPSPIGSFRFVPDMLVEQLE